MTDEWRKTKIRTNRSHSIWLSGRCNKDIYLSPWILNGLLFSDFPDSMEAHAMKEPWIIKDARKEKQLRKRCEVGNFILCEEWYFFLSLIRL